MRTTALSICYTAYELGQIWSCWFFLPTIMLLLNNEIIIQFFELLKLNRRFRKELFCGASKMPFHKENQRWMLFINFGQRLGTQILTIRMVISKYEIKQFLLVVFNWINLHIAVVLIRHHCEDPTYQHNNFAEIV